MVFAFDDLEDRLMVPGSRVAATAKGPNGATPADLGSVGIEAAAGGNGTKLKPSPQLVRGGLSALFASESRCASDAESVTGPAGNGNKVGPAKKKRNRKKKKVTSAGGAKQNGVAVNGGKGDQMEAGLQSKNNTSQKKENTNALLSTASDAMPTPVLIAPTPQYLGPKGLTFGKLPPSAYSSHPTSSASSDVEDNESATPYFSAASTSSAGTTPVQKGVLGELLQQHNAEAGDIITITSEDGKVVESYEVALEHDFTSSRPVTRAGSRERNGGRDSGRCTPIYNPSAGSSLLRGLHTAHSHTSLREYAVNQSLFLEPKEVPSRPATPTPQAPPPGKRPMCASDFEVLKCLGKGTYGTVLLVRHLSTGKLYAQKQLKKASIITTKKLVEQTMTERQILEAVRHPFIVKLYYAFQDHQKLYLILEYAQGGELFKHLDQAGLFCESTAAFYMASLVLALSHLHKNAGVVYRDLKPENCLLDAQGYLLLTDFGLSKVAVDESGRCNSWVGTVDYMAPEILEEKPYTNKVDWWSLGALGVDLMTGNPPFYANNRAKTEERIIKAKLTLPYYVSPDAKDLLGKLLKKDPQKRWGVEQVEKMKAHRFFKKVDWKKLEKKEYHLTEFGAPPIQPIITRPEMAENFDVAFTGLACSPPVGYMGMPGGGVEVRGRKGMGKDADAELFGGFSFVASWGEEAMRRFY